MYPPTTSVRSMIGLDIGLLIIRLMLSWNVASRSWAQIPRVLPATP